MLAGLLFLMMSCLMVACSDDSEDLQDEDTLQLLSYSQKYRDASNLHTRAITDDYDSYTAAPIAANIIDVTQYQNVVIGKTTFRYSTNSGRWSSAFKILEGHNYYIYGYSPADAATQSIINVYGVSYSNGAQLTLKGVETVSEKALCVIVGVKQVLEESSDVPSDLIPGRFEYVGKSKNRNFAYMLLNHICAALRFTMKVDETYDAMRTIKLKKMELKSIPKTYDVYITMKSNSYGDNPIENLTWSSNATDDVQFFDNTDGFALTTTAQALKMKLNTEELDEIIVFPALSNSMTLVCTYDVYDKKGNKIRENCTAENKLPVALNRGERMTVNLTVNPTYLYVLSDPDLDNPTIEVSSE